MSRSANRKKKQLYKALFNRKPSLMNKYDLYVLTCTECHLLFPPRYFRGQCIEFRMCQSCKMKNPEICIYLEKYIYQPQRAKKWSPFQVRLDKITRKCDLLKVELEAFKRQYCNPASIIIANEDVDDVKAKQVLQNLIEKCACFEEDLLACQKHQTETKLKES